jgi:aspartate/methionine/tyrosine aminotransferase
LQRVDANAANFNETPDLSQRYIASDKTERHVTQISDWQGRFPRNEIISLLDINRAYNLAESTAQDLTFGEVVTLAGGMDKLAHLKLGYGSSAGLPQLRARVAAAAGVNPDQVVTTQGVALGLFLLALELCRPGDEAVIVTPCFPVSRDSLVGAGVVVRECRLTFDSGYRLTPALLEPLLNERTRLVSIASPQNPSGVRVTLAEIAAIVELMQARAPAARLFVDETYRDATYGSDPLPPSAVTCHDAIITGGSVSKAHGAPGLRVGWLITREPELLERLTVAKMNMVISGSPLNEALAAAILDHRDTILGVRRTLLAQGVAIVDAWIKQQNGLIDWVRPEGGALCCVRLNPDAFDQAAIGRFWAALPDAQLQLADGVWFGETSAVLRLGFGYLPIEILPEALDALAKVIEAV